MRDNIKNQIHLFLSKIIVYGMDPIIELTIHNFIAIATTQLVAKTYFFPVFKSIAHDYFFVYGLVIILWP